METAITVLIWIGIVALGIWILSALIGAILAVSVFKKAKKEFGDDDFFTNLPSFKGRLK